MGGSTTRPWISLSGPFQSSIGSYRSNSYHMKIKIINNWGPERPWDEFVPCREHIASLKQISRSALLPRKIVSLVSAVTKPRVSPDFRQTSVDNWFQVWGPKCVRESRNLYIAFVIYWQIWLLHCNVTPGWICSQKFCPFGGRFPDARCPKVNQLQRLTDPAYPTSSKFTQ